jgi:hypothetical protein
MSDRQCGGEGRPILAHDLSFLSPIAPPPTRRLWLTLFDKFGGG